MKVNNQEQLGSLSILPIIIHCNEHINGSILTPCHMITVLCTQCEALARNGMLSLDADYLYGAVVQSALIAQSNPNTPYV